MDRLLTVRGESLRLDDNYRIIAQLSAPPRVFKTMAGEMQFGKPDAAGPKKGGLMDTLRLGVIGTGSVVREIYQYLIFPEHLLAPDSCRGHLRYEPGNALLVRRYVEDSLFENVLQLRGDAQEGGAGRGGRQHAGQPAQEPDHRGPRGRSRRAPAEADGGQGGGCPRHHGSGALLGAFPGGGLP